MPRPNARRLLVAPITAAALGLLALTACSDPPADQTTTIRVDQRDSVQHLGPGDAAALVEVQLVGLVHGRLFEFAPGSAVDTEPSLASDIDVSDDLTTHTVRLQHDLRFSDGSPLTAADVVASLTHLRDTPGFYQSEAGLFASIEAEDDSTVRITLSAPQADLTQTLALPSMSILPARYAEDPENFFSDPAFSGAYLPEGDWSSTAFSLLRNDSFGGAKPAAERLAITVISDSATSLVRLQGGETDLAQNVPPEAVSQLSGETTARITTTLAGLHIVPNNRPGSIFADPRIRAAIAWAIDRRALAEVAYGKDPIANSSPFSTTSGLAGSPVPFAERDVDRARSLLEGTACESGCEFTLSYFSSGAESEGRAAQVLTQQLAEIGMTAQAGPIEDAQFIEDSLNGNFDLQLVESGGFNPQNTLRGAFDPTSYQCISAGCESGAATEAIDAIFEAPTAEAQDEAADAFTALFEEWTPIIPVADSTLPYGIRTSVEDLITVQPNNTYRIASR